MHESHKEIIATMIPLSTAEDVLDIGQKIHFEYHCWESHESQDVELWYHSHQLVEVLGFEPNDGWDIKTQKERFECGQQIMYSVLFFDGFIGTVFEDELLGNVEEYERPDPPSRLEK